MVKHEKRLVAGCYLAAAVLWVLLSTVHLCGNAIQRHNGTMMETTLLPRQLACEAFENCADTGRSGAPDDDPDWYISTDADPHIFWQGEAYLESVTLNAEYARPAGSIVLYYLLPGQTDYSETQKVYAQKRAPGDYVFPLGGKTVTGLRIDPDSNGGVTMCWRGITLNESCYSGVSFLPDAREWLILLLLPAAIAAVWTLVFAAVRGIGKANQTKREV